MENLIKISFNYDDKQRTEIDKILNLSPKIIKSKMEWKDPYYQQMKRFFTKQKKDGYTVNDTYNVKGNGRVFGKSTTLQSVDNKLISNLFSDNTYDIDMKNASYRILKWILEREFPLESNKYPLILEYAENREEFYSSLCDKQYFISALFCSNPLWKVNASNSKKVNDLLKEICSFQILCSSQLQLWNCNFNDDDHKGQHLSKITHYYENKILQEVISLYKPFIKFLKFDGFGISKETNLENVLDEANKYSKKYGIEMIHKEFPAPIILDEPPMYAEKVDIYKEEYDAMKIVFEENHFIIINPISYYNIYKGKENVYNKGDFKDLVAPFHIDGKSFFDRWIKDDNRREYQNLIWKPVITDNLNSVNYNSFKGFEIEKYECDEINMDIVNEFNDKLILLLCGFEIPAQQYVIKFIAHMIQRPDLLPLSALLFKGQQGVGKDLLIDILEGIIGLEFIHRDGKMENIAGTFNKSLKNKLIIQLNEVSGKDGHFNKEILKDLITAKDLNIREMRTDVEKLTNYMRLILFTNNINAIDIPFDDRRYSVFKTGDKQQRTYYDKLHEIKKDKKSLKSLFNYFKNFELGDFAPDDPKDRVMTLAYEQLQNSNRNPFYEFLRDFLDKENKDFHYIIKKKRHYIKMRTIEHNYISWLLDNDYETESNSKRNKGVLFELGALEVRATLNNSTTTRFYSVNIKKIIEKLDKEHSFVKPEIITI